MSQKVNIHRSSTLGILSPRSLTAASSILRRVRAVCCETSFQKVSSSTVVAWAETPAMPYACSIPEDHLSLNGRLCRQREKWLDTDTEVNLKDIKEW